MKKPQRKAMSTVLRFKMMVIHRVLTIRRTKLVVEKMQETIQNLSRSFANEAFEQAREYVIQLQYWENIRQAIIDWSPGKRVEVHH